MGNRIYWLTGKKLLILIEICLYMHQILSFMLLFCLSRFDGRALLDFIRDSDSRVSRVQEKSEEEEELEEFVNFERYRDLIKHRRRGCRYFFLFWSCVVILNLLIFFFCNLYIVCLVIENPCWGLFTLGYCCCDFVLLQSHVSFHLLSHVYLTVTDEEGLKYVNEELEAKAAAPFASDRCRICLSSC